MSNAAIYDKSKTYGINNLYISGKPQQSVLNTINTNNSAQNKPSAETRGLVKQTTLPRAMTGAVGWIDGPTSTAT